MTHIQHNSGNGNWITPIHIINCVHDVLGFISLDPASSAIANKIVKANKIYTAEDDGLTKEWEGTVFLNPPYNCGLIGDFIDKLVSSEKITEYIVLTNNATETSWGQKLLNHSDVVFFPNRRIKFLNKDLQKADSPLQGQMICYWGPCPELFKQFFTEGVIATL